MSDKVIVTIARQYGSGGRYIGRKLAEELGCPFFDKELIEIASQESGIDKTLFESADEKPSGIFWRSIVGRANTMGGSPFSANDLPMSDRLFSIQSDIIKRIVQETSCVIVGRCADYILREVPNVTHVFIHSDLEDKIHRMVTYYDIPPNKAEDVMVKIDKKRATYYNYYTGEKWGLAQNYDLCIKSNILENDDLVRFIADIARMKAAAAK